MVHVVKRSVHVSTAVGPCGRSTWRSHVEPRTSTPRDAEVSRRSMHQGRQPASSPLDVPDSLQVGSETTYQMRWPQWFEVMVHSSPTGCLRHELWHKLALDGACCAREQPGGSHLSERARHIVIACGHARECARARASGRSAPSATARGLASPTRCQSPPTLDECRLPLPSGLTAALPRVAGKSSTASHKLKPRQLLGRLATLGPSLVTASASAQERPLWAQVHNPYLHCPGVISEMLDEIYRDVQEEMDASALIKNTLLNAHARTVRVEDEYAALRAEFDLAREGFASTHRGFCQMREDFAVRVEVAEALAARAVQQATEWKQQATEWKQQTAELLQRIESLEKVSMNEVRKRPRMTEA